MKTKIGLLAAALMLWSASAHTQNAPIFPGPSTPVSIVPEGTPLGFEQISLSGAAVGLDPPAGATFALVAVTGANANWRDDGTAPTSTIGMPLVSGQAPIAMANLQALQFISTGTSTLAVSFYK
jgi:hypothetical protein